MIGFPKHLNSKFDYEYVREHFPRNQWEYLFRGMLEEQKSWFCTKKLEDNENGYNDEQKKVVECDNVDGTKERYQYEFLNDPNSTMSIIGYTEDEIHEILKDF